MSRRILLLPAVLAMASLAACATPNRVQPDVLSTKPAVELRAMQTRAFDTTDRNKTLRTIIATLQDLGYTVDKVEPSAGTVSATKLGTLKLTATVYPRGQSRLIVRANAMVAIAGGGSLVNNQVDDPLFYQQRFFEPLAKAMFLSAQTVEGQDVGEDMSSTPPSNVSTFTTAPSPAAAPGSSRQ